MNKYLLQFQHSSESPLFQLIYKKHLEDKELTLEEQRYFDFVQTTFIVECLSSAFLLPTVISAYYLKKAFDTPQQNYARIVRFSIITTLLAIPGMNMFGYSIYRRVWQVPPHKAELELKHMNELRPKIKLIDSSRKA